MARATSGSLASAASERSGHASPSARRRNITRSRHCLRALLQGRRSTPSARTPRASASAASIVLRDGERLLGEDERPEPAATPRPQGGGGAVEGDFVRCLDRSGGDHLDIREGQRRSKEDARRSRSSGNLADREIWFARKGVVRLDRSRAPVRHQKLAAPAARDRNAVGIGGGEESAGMEVWLTLIRPAAPATFSRGEKARCRSLRKAPRQPPRLASALRPVTAEGLEPDREVDRAAAETALCQ